MSVASALPLLSPLVTRILQLSGFPPQLKTRDLQQVFSAYEEEKGGYKIKWVDDTTALIIFADPAVAKKAYLRTIMAPAHQLINDNGIPAKIKPYDGDDASAIISSVLNRQRSRSNGGILSSPTKQHAELAAPATPEASPAKPLRGHAHTPSFGRTPGGGHRRQQSGSISSLPPKPVAAALFDAANGGPSPANRVLAGVDTLSGIAGLPANPVIAARMAESPSKSPSKMSRDSSRTSDTGLESDLTSLTLGNITNSKNGNLFKSATGEGLLSAPTISGGVGKRFSPSSTPSRQSPLPRPPSGATSPSGVSPAAATVG
ncbi:Nucleotide-binding, alpha-beta plait [Kalmanozyma brasiliensis GHG001]|uniref:RRM domain-containing protein n=1 Tax=Kalmanozyma brasiliensis (strain GHG001) TaxID=1365824 RepID=V5EUA2_KALBG|nr:Nucleotide-binding, alpha-beta plait [Kalmanozyma brasiliensis GHG001]EST06713.1 Nucleotide-binding, alpha-beta plait [Kalmanozyma brasiliensis GHG001]